MAKRKPRVRVGLIVAITFLDHAEDGDALTFVVYGRVAKVTRTAYTVESWAYEDPAEPDLENVTRYTIVRRAITHVDILMPVS